ncbi:hypothetical protein CASFOL_021128 [Castilleja foliolosa]|uniref:Uncharacterized protein n=1 Tax=Castilleja foliolosa TaxID=1961234 RepID=A0ABD3CY76_9LAMI
MMAEEVENGEFVITSSKHDKSAKQIDGCFVKCGDFLARCSTIRHILPSLKSDVTIEKFKAMVNNL